MNFTSENFNTYQITNLTPTNTNVQVIFYPTTKNTGNNNSNLRKSAFLNKFQDLVEAYYQDDRFRGKQLADMLNMSETQLFRKLKALTNQGFASYLKLYRLRKAKDLIENYDDLNISEIAYEVGFNDPNYFSRAFSEAFGQTPSSLRRQAFC